MSSIDSINDFTSFYTLSGLYEENEDIRSLSVEQRGDAVLDAAARGDLKTVNALLAGGAEISEHNLGLAIIDAGRNSHIDVVYALLANGAQLSEKDRSIMVGVAICYSRLEEPEILNLVNAILSTGPTTLEFRGEAVFEATWRGYSTIVSRLLDKTH